MGRDMRKKERKKERTNEAVRKIIIIGKENKELKEILKNSEKYKNRKN